MKALPMPLLCIEGTANFPYQILLVSFHLQYRNALCVMEMQPFQYYENIKKNLQLKSLRNKIEIQGQIFLSLINNMVMYICQNEVTRSTD